jgi:protein-S-isoprenylcysteine O-methyltransferase Ste14
MNPIFSYILIVLAWFIFGLIHSILTTNAIKDKAYQSGVSPLAYRRFYNVLAIILFFLILFGGGFITPEYFMPHGKSSQGVGLIIATFGFFLIKLAFKEVNFGSFIGWEKEKKQQLVTSGIYGRIRHPLYTATILFLIGFVIFSPSYTHLIHAISLFVYLMIGIQHEEKRMIKDFGDAYIKYKEQVPMLLPRLGMKK